MPGYRKDGTLKYGTNVSEIENMLPKFLEYLDAGWSLSYSAKLAGFDWEYWSGAIKSNYPEIDKRRIEYIKNVRVKFRRDYG